MNVIALNADLVRLRPEAYGTYTAMLRDSTGKLCEATRLEALLIVLNRPALRGRLLVPGDNRGHSTGANSFGGHAA